MLFFVVEYLLHPIPELLLHTYFSAASIVLFLLKKMKFNILIDSIVFSN